MRPNATSLLVNHNSRVGCVLGGPVPSQTLSLKLGGTRSGVGGHACSSTGAPANRVVQCAPVTPWIHGYLQPVLQLGGIW